MKTTIDTTNKVILLTGASSGLGHLTTKTLARAGHTVYAAMRDLKGRNQTKAEALLDWAKHEGLALHLIELDVTDQAAIEGSVQQIVAAQGRIDVLVNNAGVMNVGITEAYTAQQLQQQMQVNFFGPVQLDRAVIPQMRQQGSGLLLHISSLAGGMVFPYFGIYCASKAALESMAEAYRYELSGQGIDSIIVQPGPFATGLIGNSPKPADQERLKAYGEAAAVPEKMLESFEQFYASDNAMDPQTVADDVSRLIALPAEQRPLRTVSGLDYGLRSKNEQAIPIQQGLLQALGMQQMDPTFSAASAESVS